MKTFTLDDIGAMDKLVRVQFASSLPGVKPVCLVGTRNAHGLGNLAPFSSVVHLGSNPALLGMITRPDTVERHTLANILERRRYTLNHLHREILEPGHQCSARYPSEVSEFDATGLTPHQEGEFLFVAESRFRIGLNLVDILPIEANNTRLIIGAVQCVQVPGESVAEDGSVDLPGLGVVASTALDTYFDVSEVARLPYAKP